MKIDVFPHILPRKYFERLLAVAPPGLALQKRMSGIPVLVDLDLRFTMMDRWEGYVQVLTLANPPIEVVAPPATSPAQLALLIWQTQIPLPHPAPYIAPGYAITGKRAYLEIRDNPSLSPQHFNELGYDITVEATSTYDVVWGDGAESRDVSSTGGPYPSGNITHVYDNIGTYTVRILQTWHGRYTVNGTTGTIDVPLTTDGAIQGFPVHQLEAVTNR